ncbi:MAG: LysR family transcriptional regulator [Massilia sp.]|nr:LysR family transcriptional regulator [Massilia sp.]
MKLTQLDGLLAFTAVARQGSFTTAAALLEVTPSAISQTVRQLEERLGVRLLHRTTRSVRLTEAGEQFLARVAPAVAEITQAAAELDEYRGGASGVLRLNMAHIAYAACVRPLLPGFLARHPAIKLELDLDDGFVDIVAGGFDAGVRLGESVQLDMVSVPLTRQERICMVASPDYAARRGLPDSIEALQRHDCIRFRFRKSQAIYRWEVLRDGQLIEVEVGGPLTVSSSVEMAAAALDGIGIAYVFVRQVEADLAAGRLVPVLPDCWPTFTGFHLYYPTRKQMPAKLRAFIDYCTE